MTTEFDPTDFDEQYFEDVITSITGHPDWEYAELNSQSPYEAAEKASEFKSSAEVFVNHSDTDGQFRFGVPGLSEPVEAAQGVLTQPLDGTQNAEPYPGSFGEKVKQAYQSVVEDHEAEYLDMDPNTLDILSMGVPLDYDDRSLEQSLDTASEVSREVQDLNDEVMAVLEERI